MSQAVSNRDLGMTERAARAAHDARLVVAYAELTGLVEPVENANVDVQRFNQAVHALKAIGVARGVDVLHPQVSDIQYELASRRTNGAIEDSPLPEVEWPALSKILEHLLPGLLGVSASSVVRYSSAERQTPDHVADRLHALTLIVRDLAGSYNAFGIRRWFQRRRTALADKSPADVLAGPWDPDGVEPQAVRALAASLAGPGSAL